MKVRSGLSLIFRSFGWALAQSIREVKPEMIKKMIQKHHMKSFNFTESSTDQVDRGSGPSDEDKFSVWKRVFLAQRGQRDQERPEDEAE